MLKNLYDNRIRPIAISIIKNQNKILVYKREDEISKEKFFRLVGGCIEFGERSEEALKREFQEELSLDIINIQLLGIFESIFTFNNKQMHEIVYLYNSEFKAKNIYNKNNIKGYEGERKFDASWVPVADFINEKEIIYPEEILKYL